MSRVLKPSVESAINDQVNQEFEAAYLYLSMSAHFESVGLAGFARWMRLQSQEELAHGLKLFDYVQARGGRARLQAIGAPPQQFGKPIEIARHLLQHEQKVTQLIGKLYETAAQERDHVTAAQLQWFLTEQVEEEKTATDLVQRVELAGDEPHALLLIDKELGARTSTA